MLMETNCYRIRKLGNAWEVSRHMPSDNDGTMRGTLIAIVPTLRRARQIVSAA